MESKKLQLIIKSKLKQQGKTIEELCTSLQISRAGYSQSFKKESIKLSQIEDIAAFLNIPVPLLLLDLYFDNYQSEIVRNTFFFTENIQKSIQKNVQK